MIFYPHRTSARLLDALNQGDAKKDSLDLTLDTGVGSGGPERTNRVRGILEAVRVTKDTSTGTTSEFYTVDLERPALRNTPSETNQPSK
jgi:hypothetical protein